MALQSCSDIFESPEIVCVKRVIGGRCEWMPLTHAYDLQAIVNRANERHAQTAIITKDPEAVSACGVRTTLLPFAVVWDGRSHLGFRMELASDGKRYFVHFEGVGDCYEESEIRSEIEQSLADLPMTDDARRELLGLVRVTTKKAVKMVSHLSFT